VVAPSDCGVIACVRKPHVLPWNSDSWKTVAPRTVHVAFFTCLVSAIAVTIGCGGSLVDMDASNDAASEGDATPDGADASPKTCTADASPPTVLTCDGPSKTACQAWAQSMVYSGTVYTQCVDVDAAAIHGCAPSDACTVNSFGFTTCSCGALAGGCVKGQVCVGVPPMPLEHICVPACSQ
jgi:hypothetical protein